MHWNILYIDSTTIFKNVSFFQILKYPVYRLYYCFKIDKFSKKKKVFFYHILFIYSTITSKKYYFSF